MVFFLGEGSNCFSSLLPYEEEELEETPKEDSPSNVDGDGKDAVQLPESCIAHTLGFTTPLDACRSAPVSKTFWAASVTDIVWERFLPHDYKSILARAVPPVVEFSSKRELFLCLCYRPLLIDEGAMGPPAAAQHPGLSLAGVAGLIMNTALRTSQSFWLWKSSGAKCFMISARKLKIRLGYAPDYWRWISLEESRFPEVAELVGIRFLEISGKIDSGILSVNTTYTAYLVFKLSDEPYGLTDEPMEATVKVGKNLKFTQIVCVDTNGMSLQNGVWQQPISLWRSVLSVFGVEVAEDEDEKIEIPSKFPQARDDGWMEIELGEFYVSDDQGESPTEEIKMSLKEMKGRRWKKGLLVQGIEIRPKV